jgi:hypothetical protein
VTVEKCFCDKHKQLALNEARKNSSVTHTQATKINVFLNDSDTLAILQLLQTYNQSKISRSIACCSLLPWYGYACVICSVAD